MWCAGAFTGLEKNKLKNKLVTLVVHCHIYRATIHPQRCRPHPVTPLFCLCHLPFSAGMDGTAVKEGPPALQPTSLSGQSLYSADLFVM